MTTPDLVIGLDSSTQSTKAIAWNREGTAIAEGRAPHDMTMPQPGHVEQDSGQWWDALCTSVREVIRQTGPERIAGMAISNQRETSVFVDENWRAVHPAIVWVDERGRSQLPSLDRRIGADRIHRITGKPFDLTPPLTRFDWLREHDPETLKRARHVIDAQCFLLGHLSGRKVTSWISADPSGIFDINAKAWSEELYREAGLSPDQLPEVQPPGKRAGSVSAAAAKATGLSEGTPLFLAGGDGQCAGLGVNAVREGTIYLNLGTALIMGVWAPEARISRYWRTMTSPTGEGYFLEAVQRTGAMLLNWLVDNFMGGRADPEIFAKLDAQAAEIPPGSEGVTMSPYLSGCMDPHWDTDARAAIIGLGVGHTAAHVYRAALEALTAESVRAMGEMRAQGLKTESITAVGGGAVNSLWIRMFADASGLPVARSRSVEASSLGAAMIAATGAGWFGSVQEAAGAMAAEDPPVRPDPAARPVWDELLRRQADVYRPSAGQHRG